MDYEVSISIKAIEFILFPLRKEGTRLLFEFQRLGSDPHREADFSDKGDEGDLNGILIDEYAVLYHINRGDLLDVREQANKEKFPHQKVLIVKMNEYVYAVPFVEEGETWF